MSDFVELNGYKVKDKGAKHTYDTVVDLKADTKLKANDHVETKGYTTIGDNGHASYIIVDDETLIDNGGSIHELANGLKAVMLINESVNVKQFGAKGDGTSDDTTAIQTALDVCSTVYVPDGTYMINAITHINLNNGNRLLLNNNATLKAITNSETNYAVIWIENVSDVEVGGGTIEGERLTHTGEGGEWGHCIRLYGDADEVYIHDINLINAWGDGICCKVTGSIYTERVHVNNARRNGYSIARCESFTSNNDFIENTNGTYPKNGVDIEPDGPTEQIKNITFNNLITKNNGEMGLGIFLLNAGTQPTKITINNIHDYGSRIGVGIAKHSNTKGLITINSPYLESSGDSAIRLHRCYDSELAVKIINPYILNCDQNGEGPQYGAGISAYVTSTEEDYPLGNIEIIEPFIQTAYANQTSAISIRSYVANASLQANNIKIINPIYLNGDVVFIGKSTNVEFRDDYNTTEFHTDSNYTIDLRQYHSIYTNTDATASNRTLTIPEDMEIGRKLKFMNRNSDYRLSVKLPANDYCPQLSDIQSGTIRLPKLGETVELQKISSTQWIVTDINCNPTVE